ncbi:MAG: ABC transporter permease subunit [Deinococcales bacterium]
MMAPNSPPTFAEKLREWSDKAAGTIFLLPSIIVVLFLAIFPLIISLYLSLSRVKFEQGGVKIEFIGFSNYAKLFIGSQQSHFLGVIQVLSWVEWLILAIAMLIFIFFAYQYWHNQARKVPSFIGYAFAYGLGTLISFYIFFRWPIAAKLNSVLAALGLNQLSSARLILFLLFVVAFILLITWLKRRDGAAVGLIYRFISFQLLFILLWLALSNMVSGTRASAQLALSEVSPVTSLKLNFKEDRPVGNMRISLLSGENTLISLYSDKDDLYVSQIPEDKKLRLRYRSDTWYALEVKIDQERGLFEILIDDRSWEKDLPLLLSNQSIDSLKLSSRQAEMGNFYINDIRLDDKALSTDLNQWQINQGGQSSISVTQLEKVEGASLVIRDASGAGRPGTLVVTLAYVLVGIALQYVIGLSLALLTTQKLTGRRFFRVIFLLPMMITPVGVAYTFRMLADTSKGPFKPLWEAVGLGNFSWAESAWSARWAVMIGDIWQWTPFMFIILLAAVEGLPDELFEAAHVDGASRWQIFLNITLPQLIPVSATVILIRMIEAFKIVDLPNVLTNGGPGTATESLTLHSFFTWRALDLGGSAAIAYILMLLSLFFGMTYANLIHAKLGR